MTFTGVGPLAATGGTHKMVAISDPVAGAHYMLNPDKKVAYKMTLPAGGAAGNTAKVAGFCAENAGSTAAGRSLWSVEG